MAKKIEIGSIWIRKDGGMVKIQSIGPHRMLFSFKDRYGRIVHSHGFISRKYLLRSYVPFMGA